MIYTQLHTNHNTLLSIVIFIQFLKHTFYLSQNKIKSDILWYAENIW